jgi:hypothetical protein
VAGGAKGILDTSYGVGGRVAYTASSQAPVSSLVVTPDGTAYAATQSDVVRIDNVGRAFAGLGFYGTRMLALDRRGNVFGLVGSSLYKLDPAGQAVTSFGSGGFALAGSSTMRVTLFITDAGGTLYVAGFQFAEDFRSGSAVIAKLNAEGQSVPTFGRDGRIVVPALPSGIAVDDEGNLYVSYGSGGDPSLASALHVAKLDRNGNPVASFANAGIWAGPRSACDSGGIALDAAGFVFVAGNCTDASGVSREILVKLDARGALVQGFGAGGVAERFLDPVPDEFRGSAATDVAIGPDGTVYVSGYLVIGGCVSRRLFALDVRGNRIASFGDAGSIRGVLKFAPDAVGRIYTVEGGACPPGSPPPGGGALVSRYL